jgi:hypothetical protein
LYFYVWVWRSWEPDWLDILGQMLDSIYDVLYYELFVFFVELLGGGLVYRGVDSEKYLGNLEFTSYGCLHLGEPAKGALHWHTHTSIQY